MRRGASSWMIANRSSEVNLCFMTFCLKRNDDKHVEGGGEEQKLQYGMKEKLSTITN